MSLRRRVEGRIMVPILPPRYEFHDASQLSYTGISNWGFHCL